MNPYERGKEAALVTVKNRIAMELQPRSHTITKGAPELA